MSKRLEDNEFNALQQSCGQELFELCITDEDEEGEKTEDLYIYLVKPAPGAYNIYINAALNGDKLLDAMRELVLHCVKVPDRASLAKLLDSKKSYANKILSQINRLEGEKAAVTLKKRK